MFAQAPANSSPPLNNAQNEATFSGNEKLRNCERNLIGKRERERFLLSCSQIRACLAHSHCQTQGHLRLHIWLLLYLLGILVKGSAKK